MCGAAETESGSSARPQSDAAASRQSLLPVKLRKTHTAISDGRCIAGTVQDTHNDDFGFSDQVINRVMAVESNT